MHGTALRTAEEPIAMPAAMTSQGASIAASELVKAKVAVGSRFFSRSSKCCRWGEPGGAHTPASRSVPSGSASYCGLVTRHLDRALIQPIAGQPGGQGDHHGDHRPDLAGAADQLPREEEAQPQAGPFPEHVDGRARAGVPGRPQGGQRVDADQQPHGRVGPAETKAEPPASDRARATSRRRARARA